MLPLSRYSVINLLLIKLASQPAVEWIQKHERIRLAFLGLLSSHPGPYIMNEIE